MEKLPIIEAVQWMDAKPNQIAHRFPKVSLKYGSQVIVMENQWAVFFRDGKALDVLGPGRHTITSANIPILTDLVKRLGLIGDIFECEVVYVTNSQMRANFGGQAYSAPSGQIAYQAEISFFGYLLYKVEEPKLFVTEFFGNRNASTSEDVENYIRGFVVERVIDAFGEYQIPNLVRNVDEVTDKTALVINNEARRAGLTVIDAVFEGVKIPEEARRFASGMGQQAMAMQYAKETAQVLPDGGGGAAGAGIGAGLGLGMGAQMMRGMQPESAPQRVVVCPSCGSQNPEGNKFCAQCGGSLQPKGAKCPSCGTENPAANKFCSNCGKSMAPSSVNCPKCGTANQGGQKFCGSCGEKIA
jgi:membrane protease subunit (stomatin/prohibitin family)